jgi:hypothetical protein
MTNIPEDLYNKIVKLSSDVKKDLMSKGVVIPVKNDDGTVNVGYFTIVKDRNTGCYSITDRSGEVVVKQINLPQTAAITANNLALGKFRDANLLDADRRYGYALFDELLHKKAVEKSNKKSLEYFDLMLTKSLIAKAKKEKYKQDVVKSFEKLIKLV